jgi:hypothetical protein
MTTRTRRALAVAALCFGAAAARGGDRVQNVNVRKDPVDCRDVRVEFEDAEAVRAEERVVIPYAAGRALAIEAARNSGVRVRGADRSDFEVRLCKASPSADGLSEIALVRGDGTIGVRGPRGEDWVGYLLVEAPRGAALELSAENGPIGLDGLTGRVVARTHNGPISVEDSAGTLDLAAQNGPIDFQGEAGSSRLRTQNGPIGVELTGTSWNGAGLDARAVNGPLSVSIPAGYRSGTVVESKGRSPFQCRGSACDGARRTWDDDNRRIELGEGPTLVRVSTENGPVAVRTGGGADSKD